MHLAAAPAIARRRPVGPLRDEPLRQSQCRSYTSSHLVSSFGWLSIPSADVLRSLHLAVNVQPRGLAPSFALLRALALLLPHQRLPAYCLASDTYFRSSPPLCAPRHCPHPPFVILASSSSARRAGSHPPHFSRVHLVFSSSPLDQAERARSHLAVDYSSAARPFGPRRIEPQTEGGLGFAGEWICFDKGDAR